jgi:hypothetical protein
VRVPKRNCQRAFATRHGDHRDVVRHQAAPDDAKITGERLLAEQLQVPPPIAIREENLPPPLPRCVM